MTSDSKTEGGSAPSPSVPLTAKTVAAFRDQVLGLIDDLRSYASAWDWKYGEEWDSERAAIDAVLAARIRALIDEEPRRQAPPDALAQARSEGRAAALEAAAQIADAGPVDRWAKLAIARGIRSLINQGRDEVAPSPEITREGGAPRRSPPDTDPK